MPHTSKQQGGKKRKPSSTPSKLIEMTNFAENFKYSLQDPEVRKLLGTTLSEFVKGLMEENESLKERVKALEARQDDSDQYSRRTCLVISNIPEKEEEDTDVLVLELAKDMGVDLSPCDIGRSHRLSSLKKKQGPRDIVVRFVTYNKRAEFFRGKKHLKSIPHRINVFINEHLTKQRAHVFYEARQLRKKEVSDGTWTYDGRICVKKDDKIYQVTTVEALNESVYGRKKAKARNRKTKGLQQKLEAAVAASPVLKPQDDISDTEALSSSCDEDDAKEETGVSGDKNVEMTDAS